VIVVTLMPPTASRRSSRLVTVKLWRPPSRPLAKKSVAASLNDDCPWNCVTLLSSWTVYRPDSSSWNPVTTTAEPKGYTISQPYQSYKKRSYHWRGRKTGRLCWSTRGKWNPKGWGSCLDWKTIAQWMTGQYHQRIACLWPYFVEVNRNV